MADPALLTKAQTMPKAIIAKEMRYASIVSMLNTKLLSGFQLTRRGLSGALSAALEVGPIAAAL
jgi:hypothetical protein